MEADRNKVKRFPQLDGQEMRDILSMENNDIGPGKFELSDKNPNSEEFGTIKI